MCAPCGIAGPAQTLDRQFSGNTNLPGLILSGLSFEILNFLSSQSLGDHYLGFSQCGQTRSEWGVSNIAC